MDIAQLQSGDAVELTVDANAIPAGCYQFLEIQDQMIVLTVGPEVIIGLATDFWTKFMRPAAETGAQLSTELEFARRYGQLYAQLQTKWAPLNPSQLTFCMLSPRLMRKAYAAGQHCSSKVLYASDFMH